jgi:uncharacterized protein (TIGR00106 family)
MLVAFSVSPMGETDSVGDVVAECVRIVRASGLRCETNAMFTNVEGEWDEVMSVLRDCVEYAAEHAPRVSVTMKMDYRPGVEGQLEGKVERVERALEGR